MTDYHAIRSFCGGLDAKSGEGENHVGKILMTLQKDFQKNGIPKNTGSYV